MRKRPFLVFILVIGILVAGVVGFIQSAQFATLLKRAAVRYLPSDLGVDGNFSELAIRMFPPGVSIRSPEITIRQGNFMNLPAGSRIKAARMDLTFLPFQMLSGNIRVNQVRIVEGDIDLKFDPKAPPRPVARRKGLGVHWDELLQIRADAFALERTHVHLSWAGPGLDVAFTAEDASVGQGVAEGQQGYELMIALKDISAAQLPKDLKLPIQSVERLEGRAWVTSKGVKIENILLVAAGTKLKGSGQIQGDVLNPKGLTFEGEVVATANLESLLRLALIPAAAASTGRGELVFHGKVKSNLDHVVESLRAEGSLAASNLEYAGWSAERVEAEGAWAPMPDGGGEVTLTRAAASSPERSRVGGFQPGGGGKLEVGAFKFRLGSKESVTVPLKLDRAHLHWLAAPFLKTLYGLDLRANGDAQVTYRPSAPGRGSGVTAKLDLIASDFLLDNQRFGKSRPLKKIIQIPEILLTGGIQVDSGSFRPDGLTLSAGKSKFQATGKIDSKSGWDLNFAGNAFLEDLKQIAENDVRGEGPLSVHVHGPSARVLADFDADLKNAYYLRMDFGNLKGRITWDDDPSHLIFKDMDLRQGRTKYQGEGLIDLGDAESIAMQIRFRQGRVEDLNRIFDHFTKDFWWYPTSLAGEMSGAVNVSGGISLDKLVVKGTLSGPGWELMGERFGRVQLSGGYDRGRYALDSFVASKPTGQVSGRISYSGEGVLDWQAQTEGFLVSDFDHVARLDVPIRGELRVSSKGQGKFGAIESQTQVALWDTAVRGVPLSRSELSMQTSGGVAEIRGMAFGGQGTLEAKYDFRPGGESRMKSELDHLDFSPVLLLLNPKTIQDRELRGRVSGKLDLRFKTGEMDRLSGTLAITDYLLAKTGTRFSLVSPVAVTIDRGTFDLGQLAMKGPRGEIQLQLQSRASRISGTIGGDLDASIAEFFTSTVAQAEGLAALDFQIGGSLGSPTLNGSGELSGGTVRIAAVESAFENASGRISLRKNVISIDRVEADLANGRVTGGGTIELFVDRYPRISLNSTINGSKLRVFPFQFVKLRGKLNVRGEELPYLVQGSFVIDSGLSREKVMGQTQGRALKSARYTPPPTSTRESDYPKFKLDIDVKADQGLLVQNDLFDAELKAQIKVVNTLETPRITGTAEIVQGKMTFKDRIFAISAGSVRFDNPAVINPAFSMTANTEVGGSKIQMYASGRMDDFKIDLSSNPVMPESEILSLLALGATSEDVRKLRGDRSTYEQGEAASLVLHSLDINREIQNRTGFQIQLDESVNNQTGSSIFRPRTDGDTTVAPKIVVKRRIGKKATVSVGSTVGVGTNNQKGVNLEYQVTPGFSINGVWDTTDGAQTSKDTNKDQQSYGVDLKLQKRFK